MKKQKESTRSCSRKQKYASMLTMTRIGTSCQTLSTAKEKGNTQISVTNQFPCDTHQYLEQPG